MFSFSAVNYIFGSPGSGKTTVLAKIGRYYMRKGIPVYANFPLTGATLIDDKDVGYYAFSRSIILLDEAGITYNNRDAANKKGLMQDEKRLRYWKLVRHYKACIIVASQSWEDVDKKVRDLSQHYFLIRRGILGFTVVKPIYKKVDIDETTHQPTDMYKIDVFFRWKFVWRRRWYKYFDSYDAPPLPEFPVSPINDKNQIERETPRASDVTPQELQFLSKLSHDVV